jgi:hypothetical protein
MKVIFAAACAALAIAACVASAGAHASRYSCEVQKKTFTLSDADFDAMKKGPSEAGVTRKQFAALGPHSDRRGTICLTRLLVRELEAGTVKCADMTGRFGEYGSGYMSDAETDRLAAFQKKCP